MLQHIRATTFPLVQPIYGLLGLSDTKMPTFRMIVQLMQALMPQVLQMLVWDDQSRIKPPQAMFLYELRLLSGGQLVITTCNTYLVASLHLQPGLCQGAQA